MIDTTPAPARHRLPRFAGWFIVLLVLAAGLLILILLFGWYLLFRQPINPLPIIPVSQVPKYSTAIYGVKRPVGVAVSPSGDRIYVTQTGQQVEGLIFDAGGKPAGTLPWPDTKEHQPSYITIDPKSGDVYVSDRPAGAIYAYNRDGTYQRQFLLTQARPGWQPMGLAFDADGNLYITDFSGPTQKVIVADREGKVLRVMAEADNLNFPNGIAVDQAGVTYITDSNNGRVLYFGKGGTLLGQMGRGSGTATLGVPRGIAVDNANRVVTVDTTGGVVSVFGTYKIGSKTLSPLGIFGELGSSDGMFAFPNGIATDTRGRVYVADTFNDRIQVWAY